MYDPSAARYTLNCTGATHSGKSAESVDSHESTIYSVYLHIKSSTLVTLEVDLTTVCLLYRTFSEGDALSFSNFLSGRCPRICRLHVDGSRVEKRLESCETLVGYPVVRYYSDKAKQPPTAYSEYNGHTPK